MKNRLIFTFMLLFCGAATTLLAQDVIVLKTGEEISAPASSQKPKKITWGFRAGGGLGNYTGFEKVGNAKTKYVFSVQVGGTMEYALINHLKLGAGLLIEGKGGGYEATLSGGGMFNDFTEEGKFNIFLVTVPVYLRYDFHRFYGMTGVGLSFGADTKNERAFDGFLATYELGVGYKIFETINGMMKNLSIGIEMSFGLTELATKYFNPGTTANTYEIVLSYSF